LREIGPRLRYDRRGTGQYLVKSHGDCLGILF
jgi:hypothetical protein